MLCRLLPHDNPDLLSGIFEHLSMNWTAALFLSAVSLLTVDLATGFGWWWPGQVDRLRVLGLAAGVLFSVIALVQGMRAPVVTDYEVTLPGLSRQLDATVIVALSDLHLGSQLDANWLKKRVVQIEKAQPDTIVLLGDIYEGHSDPLQELIAELSRLDALLGVWAVLGNHEFHHGGNSKTGILDHKGMTLLINSCSGLDRGLVLADIDDLTDSQLNGHGEDRLQRAMAMNKDRI